MILDAMINVDMSRLCADFPHTTISYKLKSKSKLEHVWIIPVLLLNQIRNYEVMHIVVIYIDNAALFSK